MALLLADEAMCKRIAAIGEDFNRVLAQVQLDAVTLENMDSIGPMILGLKKIQETVLLFVASGEAINSKK